MGKALLISGRTPGGSLGGGFEATLFGQVSGSLTEADVQVNLSEDGTFSGLAARVTGGNNGGCTFVFRDAGLDGNQTISIAAGAGTAEDAVNTDVLSAGDAFCLAYTDAGTNAIIPWIKGNIEFASGHGNIHGCSDFGGRIIDIPSTTRFLAFAAGLADDMFATETQVQWKVRGYTSLEAMQVRVTANARVNTTNFTDRINGSDGTASCPFGASVTGLVEDLAVGDALVSGDLLNCGITLDTGVEDLTLVAVTATLKSTSSSSEAFGQYNGQARAASATAHYSSIGGFQASLATLSEADAAIKPGFAGVATNLRCFLSANTYTGDGTLKLMQNGVAVITATLTAGGGAGWYENTVDTVAFDDDDVFSFEWDEGSTGSITIQVAGITFAAAGGEPEEANRIFWPANLDGIGSGGPFPGHRVQ